MNIRGAGRGKWKTRLYMVDIYTIEREVAFCKYFPFEINIFLPPLTKIKPLSLYIEWHTSIPAVGVGVRPPPFFLSVSLSLTRLLQILGLKSLQISTEREKWEGCVRWEVGFRKVDVPGNGEIIWRGGGGT